MSKQRVPTWRLPDWPSRADAWIDAQLASLGIRRTGPTEHDRVRPWSTVLFVPSSEGLLRMKATAPLMANDAGITAVLSTIAPDALLRPLAVDGPARLMLLPEGGPVLREQAGGGAQLADWERILPRMAELQRAAASHATELLTSGALDRRAAVLPAQLNDLLERLDDQPDAGDARLRQDERERLLRVPQPFAEACEELASYGVPDSIQHDDFHDANILLADAPSGFGYRFVDWGDAYVGSPFAVLLVTLRVVEDRFGLSPGAPGLRRLEDAYLEPWTAIAPPSELRRVLALARHVGEIPRALIWDASLRSGDEAERAQWAYGLPAWLREIADDWAPATA